ncbi:ATPase domain-containing protein [Dankookia sp. P2]|uniref:ATPase domain-containing protein n=1 Tax=Dankookia sp. P2 TaxID=3423955 RepID=UPI003D66BDF5
MRVIKYRGQAYRGGFHDFAIDTGGVRVFPRLIAAEHRVDFARSRQGSGIPGLDLILGGGVERGSSTLLLGPAGSGKSLLSLQVIAASVARGEKAAFFVFDEELGLLIDRAQVMGFDLPAMQASGALLLEQVDAAELSPARFAHQVRHSVDAVGIRTVVIDSLNGYQAAMPDERDLILHIHEIAAVPEPAGHHDLPAGRAARAGRRHDGLGGRHLPGRYGDPAALFRGHGPGAPGHLGHQEARRRA